MKLHLDSNSTINMVTAYAKEYLEVNQVRYGHAIVLWPDRPVTPWAVSSVADIDASSLNALLPEKPEVVLVGTGAKQHFLHPKVSAAFASARIGVETMSTAAACRTYNILVSEDRKVVALLLPAL